MANRTQITLPDDAAATLQRLVTDCDLSPSQCITQLLRRHGADLHRLLSVNVAIGSTSVAPMLQQVAPGCSTPPAEVAASCTKLQPAVDGGAKALAFFDSMTD
jgi:hypothetical protein